MQLNFMSASERQHWTFRIVAGLAVAVLVLIALVARNGSVARTDSTTGTYESLGVPLPGFTIPATNSWPEGGLLYALAVEGGTDSGPFMVYDINQRTVIYSGNQNIVTNHRMIAVDKSGNAYFSVNGNGLAKYDPSTNSVSVLPVTFASGGWMRAATRETEDGWIYGVTRKPEKVFRFNPNTVQLQEVGTAWGYTTHVVIDPTERYMYYMPDAHGNAFNKEAPVLQYDTQTNNHKVIAFLNDVLEAREGFRIGGAYALDIDETGQKLFMNLNAVDLAQEPGATLGFGNPATVLVNIPSSEAPIVVTPSFSFKDVAAESGIDALLSNTYLHTASWGDVNNDGWLDLFAGTFASGPTQSPNKLLLNQAGSFSDSGETALGITGRASGSVFADFDNDGDVDLYISNNKIAGQTGPSAEPSRLLRNDNGSFVDVTAGSGIDAQSTNGRQAGVLDYNGDGLLDLFVVADSLRNSGPTVLLRNNGGLQFTDVTSAAGLPTNAHGLGFAIGDMTGNGWPDIFVAGEVDQFTPNGNFLFVANGNGTYHEYTGSTFNWAAYTNGTEDWVSGASLADLNRDGRLDMVVGQHFGSSVDGGQATKVRVYMNRGTLPNGDPDFDDITNSTGLPGVVSKLPHVELQDFDNDGWTDIYTSVTVDTPDGPAPLIFRNNGNSGDPTFSLPPNIPSIQNPHYYAGGPTADFNGDGKLDIFLAEWRSTLGTPVPSRLMQNTGAPGNWLQVRMEGDTSAGENTMGVGGLVKIYKAGTTQLIGAREISPSFGWSSSQPAIAHFGLGNERYVDVVVKMPFSGSEYRRDGVPANRMLTMPNGIAETSAHLGLSTSASVITSSGFLSGPSGLPAHSVANTAPTVEFMEYDLPNYAGNPWSTWGGTLYASNGRFYAAIGDHLTFDGNSYLYEYDPVTMKLKAVGDINTAVGHVPGAFGHGKIHSQINDGGDGYIYMASYRGSKRTIVFDSNFTGAAILRYPVGAANTVSSGQAPPPQGTPTPVPTPQPTPTPVPLPVGERVADGLISLYEFEEGAGSSIADSAGVGAPIDLTIQNSAAITWVTGGMRVDSEAIIESAAAAGKISDAVKASGEITVEAWITPSNLAQTGPARIVSISSGSLLRNVTLGQSGNEYNVRLRSTNTSLNGVPQLDSQPGAVTQNLQQVVFTRSSAGLTTLYINGVSVQTGVASGTLSSWDSSFKLALANEIGDSRAWLGEYYLVAIYAKDLSQEEISHNFAQGEGGGTTPPGPTPTPEPQPTSTPVPPVTPTLVLSNWNRTVADTLDGATVVGDLYVRIAGDSNVNTVDFYLDDPGRTGSPFRTDSGSPFDFDGEALSAASPFDSTRLQNGSHNITAVITPIAGAADVLSATFTVNNPPPNGLSDELLVFDWDQPVTESHRGFPDNDPPIASANGDWTQQPNFDTGTFHFRVEVDSQPVPQDMLLQFCVWQFSLDLESCTTSIVMVLTGNPGTVHTASQPIANMWKKNGNPINWSVARDRYGIAIKNQGGSPVSDFQGWNWNGENPAEWYPLDMRFTVVVVEDGGVFDGWDNYVSTPPQPTPTPVPQPTSTPVPQATETPVPQPTETPVPQPTSTPVPQPTSTPVPQPTATPVPPPSGGGGGGSGAPPPPPTQAPSGPVAPAAPRGVNAIVDGLDIVLEIAVPLVTGGSPITGYRVLSSPDATIYFINRLADGDTLTIPGLTVGVNYQFQVRAINAVGMSPSGTMSNTATITEVVSEPTPTPALAGAPSDPPPEPGAPEPTAVPTPVVSSPPAVVPTKSPVPVATRTPRPVQQVPRPRVTSTAQPTATPVPTSGRPGGPAAAPTTASAKVPDVATTDLNPGWNLVSFPVLPEDRSIEAVFISIAGLYSEISTIRNGEAVSYVPGRPANTLTEITSDHGYWIRMSKDATIVTVGAAVPGRTEIELNEGWNLVPYVIDRTWPVRFALSSIAGKYDEVRGFDTEAVSFFPALPAAFNTLHELEAGRGYLIHMNQPAVLTPR